MPATSLGALKLLLAHAHPALVHAPIAAALFLPLALTAAIFSKVNAASWLRTSRFLALLGLLGGIAAMSTGFLWARDLGGIAAGAWVPHPFRPSQSFLFLLRDHQRLALSGLVIGVATFALVQGAFTNPARWKRAALVLSLLWAAVWGAAGHWGGRMVFPEPAAETLLQNGEASGSPNRINAERTT